MTSKINSDVIKKVGELSRLELTDAEIEGYVKSIGDILEHVEQLSQVNLIGAEGKEVEPMYHGIDGALKLRPDEVVEFSKDEHGQPKVLRNAPEVIDHGFKVPQII